MNGNTSGFGRQMKALQMWVLDPDLEEDRPRDTTD
jgi:hypothetical protein